MTRTLLMVVTGHDRIDGQRPTGLWLEEFAVPYIIFIEAGLHISVSSPEGGPAPIDPRSIPQGEKISQWRTPLAVLEETAPLSTVVEENYDALFLPGGHGTMFDLPGHAGLAAMISRMDAAGRPVGAVCHGPCGLLNAVKPDGTPLVAGRRVTAFTDAEEREVQLADKMPFLLESRMRELGADFVTTPNWQDHVEVDGNLVTGQNPQSSGSAAKELVRLLLGEEP